MDNLTHTLFALTLANSGFGRAGRGVTSTLVLASSVPDIEFVTGLLGDRTTYLSVHRGPTHGPLALALGAATAATVYLARKARRSRSGDAGNASFPALILAATTGVLGHLAMDFATSYGTRLLSPFSEMWYGVDWLPVVDPFVWLILGGGLLLAWLTPARRRQAAAFALLLTAGYCGLRAYTHVMAVDVAVERQLELGVASERPAPFFAYRNSTRPAALPAALPRRSSPFSWRLIVRTPEGFEVSEVNVLSPRAKEVERILFRDEEAAVIGKAAAAPTAKVFLDFSRFPSAEVRRHRSGGATVHWYDIRFGRRASPGDWRSATSPFGAWVRLSPEGEIVGHGLGPG